MKNVVTNEIKNRLYYENIKKARYEIVGVEIKSRRVRLGITLDALSQSICSVSYLCKIERNRIEPNVAFLREICERLDLTEDKADILLNLKEVLNNCVSAFLRRDVETIKKAVDAGEGFDNYRYALINFIYCLATKDLYTSNRIYNDLLPIIGSMIESDFLVFSVFSAIMHYHNFHFKEAIEIINGLENFKLTDSLKALGDLYCLYSAAAMSSADTGYLFEKVKISLAENGLPNILDEARYITLLYYLRAKCTTPIARETKAFVDTKYKNSINLIKAFNNGNVAEIIKYKDEPLTEYANLLYTYVKDKAEFDKMVSVLDRDYYNGMIDTVYIDYLANKDNPDFNMYIFRELIPRASLVGDFYMKYFITLLVAKLPSTPNKNRTIMRAIVLLNNDENFEDDKL